METGIWTVEWAREEEPRLAALAAELPGHMLIGASEMKLRRAQRVAAWALLCYGLRVWCGILSLPEIEYGSHGKPAFREFPGLHFSLSHTDGFALCALSAERVGVDAERIRPVSQERAERLHLSSESNAFFAEWVERESRIKRRGGSAISCRRTVTPLEGERYVPLQLSPMHTAGVALEAESELRLFKVSLEELESALRL